ncbi:MAG: trimeric intracellular cation channel family protein [Gracilimonas sp.]|uniref:trimeric intracellular cation channel family protein n=1 Tax=Gracilimonas TaxID=649462 RepID=UPI001B00B4CB|nr:trimeric intracellular cation channel family protein [Gracilimonas sp.]MBO6585052.1 trimeric intracellular cation channel family protein [Gracilimonas sp.]MBO6615677.1 trimeric intracellular cation channel family protein [Gracilimonas sp.]
MDLIYLLDLIGTFVFAISGIRIASRINMDVFGASVVGFVTAIGGGTVRDLLLDSHPITWMADMTYPLVILAAVPFTFLMGKRLNNYSKTIFIFDTIGIALFTIIGMEKALSFGFNPFIAGMMGMISAVVGGITRDVLCREVPLIFRKEIYATACLAGAIIFYLGLKLNLPENLNYLFTTAVIITIRTVSIKWNLSLPKMKKV